jgi:hypothetical protein
VRVGITGHQQFSASTQDAVAAEIARELAQLERPLVGVTSLAAGADQLFADLVVKAGGRLAVIVPARNYITTFSRKRDRDAFSRFCALADDVTWLPFDHASEEAYWEAGQEVVDRCDLLLAVWDGRDAAGLGGTADVVAYARHRGRSVKVIWPAGATRA